MTSKERLYAVMQGKPVDRVPVVPIFMMYAAHFIGRSYRDFCLDGSVLAAAQIAIHEACDTDQLTTLTDPWRESHDFGMRLDYPPEGVGIPLDGPLLKQPGDLARLRLPVLASAPRMQDRIRAVDLLAKARGDRYSVLGWIEGPMAMYSDLRGLEDSLVELMEEPQAFHDGAKVLVDNAIQFARAQVEAGADMIGMGDAACSVMGPDLYRRHIVPYEKQIVEAIHEMGATCRLHICGNIAPLIKDIATIGTDLLDIDWMVPLTQARLDAGEEVTLLGNFDPVGVLLKGTPQKVADVARQCIIDGGRRFALMPGCEVPPGTPLENLRAFCPGEGSLIMDALVKR